MFGFCSEMSGHVGRDVEYNSCNQKVKNLILINIYLIELVTQDTYTHVMVTNSLVF